MELQGLDTLEATRVLESAGMESEHAEAVVQVVKTGAQGLATKADLLATKADLKTEIAAVKADLAVLEARMDAKLEALERRLTNRMYFGFGVLFAALVAVRFFP